MPRKAWTDYAERKAVNMRVHKDLLPFLQALSDGIGLSIPKTVALLLEDAMKTDRSLNPLIEIYALDHDPTTSSASSQIKLHLLPETISRIEFLAKQNRCRPALMRTSLLLDGLEMKGILL